MPKFDWCGDACKRCCLFDCMFHVQIHTLDFGTYQASLGLYMIKCIYQTCVKFLSVIKITTMIMMKCKHHDSHITFGTEPMGKHCSLIDNKHIDQPCVPQSR